MLELHNIHYRYPGGAAALQGVSFSLADGERAVLMGPNGAGKSTLARVLIGLLRPDEGSVQLNGQNTAGRPSWELARQIAYVFQNPYEQIFNRTVWDEAAFGVRQLSGRSPESDAQVETALTRVGLLDKARRHPYDLGYAECKLLGLAGALAAGAEVLVLDEPTAGLDTRQIARVEAILDALRGEQKSVLVITHEIDWAAEQFERLLWLQAGRLLFDAPLRRLAADPPADLPLPAVTLLARRLGLSQPLLTADELAQAFLTPI